jgi:hypothetical protein
MTGEIPSRECEVDGCEKSAVARLYGDDRHYPGELRCRTCLLYDLGVRGR